jgi:hypothetical protein
VTIAAQLTGQLRDAADMVIDRAPSARVCPQDAPTAARDPFSSCPQEPRIGALEPDQTRALCRTRTGDPFLTMEVLYQLS